MEVVMGHRTPRFMRVYFERDGGAMQAVVTVPYLKSRTTSEDDARTVARAQLVGDGWIAVKFEERGNVE